MRDRKGSLAVSAACAALVAALYIGAPGQAGAFEYKKVEPLLDTGTTIIDQPIIYPDDGPARITSSIVTLLPGEETGWHEHGVPTYGYMIEGELTVDYGDEGKRVYRHGDALMEAVDHPHNGVNTGDGPMRVLVVFMSSENGVESRNVPAPGD
jgi:quercetin dioxygenase-like cupin family protein